jgi:hypothetical protein
LQKLRNFVDDTPEPIVGEAPEKKRLGDLRVSVRFCARRYCEPIEAIHTQGAAAAWIASSLRSSQ